MSEKSLIRKIKADPIRLAQVQFAAFLGLISLMLFYKIHVYSAAQAFIHLIMSAAILGAIRGRE